MTGDSTANSKTDNPSTPSTQGMQITLLQKVKMQSKSEDEQPLPNFSECLYGVPEQDALWDQLYFPQFWQDNDDDDDDDDDENQQKKDSFDASSSNKKHDNNYTMEEIWKRQARVRGHPVSMPQLRRLAAAGIPDEGSHRGVVWRILLGPYLPPDDIDKWQTTLQEKRWTYTAICERWFPFWDDWNYGQHLCVHRRQPTPASRRSKTDATEQTPSSSSGSPGTANDVILNLNVDEDYQFIHITAHRPDEDDEDSCHSDAKVKSKKRTRPKPSVFLNNPNVLDHVPKAVQDAWTSRGKDLHILKSLMKSFNALRLPQDTSLPGELSEFIDSAELLDEIRKDVVRTHSDLSFFLDPLDDLGRRRYAAIERILFLWARYNTGGVRYVQGMNEIVGSLYYVLANDARTEWANAAEADTYWLFNALLEEMRDVFVPELDAVDTGIRGRISAMEDLLERHDPALHEHFNEIGIDASFYAVRWLTTLLSREFLLPDTIRLWDSMFASTHKDNFLRYVCVTMLFVIRDKLLQGDFGQCIKLLQKYPSTHVDNLLDSSRSLYMYEMQITVACHKANLSQHDALLTIAPPPNLIMAFGFRKGVPPASLTSANTGSTAERFQSATRAVASSAVKFYQRMFSLRPSTNQETAQAATT